MFSEAEDKNKQVISSDLIDLIESEDASLWLTKICTDNGIENENTIENVSYQVGLTLLGKLPPADLPRALEKSANLNPEIAHKIYQGTEQRIFSRVKDDLSKLYSGTPVEKRPVDEEKHQAPRGKDSYLEKIE